MISERSRSQKRVFGTNLTNTYNSLSSSSREIKKCKNVSLSRKEPEISIHDYLKSVDISKKPSDMFEERNVEKAMRRILVEWLVDVQEDFKLSQETLYLGIGIFDKVFIPQRNFRPEDVQLVGITSLWIAAKFEEVYPPQFKNFAEITNGAYSKKDLLRMEGQIMNYLSFNLSFPTRYHFLLLELEKLGVQNKTLVYEMCQYLCQNTLTDIWEYKEHEIAEAAIFLAYKMLQKHKISGNEIEPTVNVKKIAFKLAKIVGKSITISKKYDCEEKSYVGGYSIERRERN